VGPFNGEGIGNRVGDDIGVDVGLVVWVGVGVGDEPLKRVKPNKENTTKPTNNTVKTKTATTTYRFFMMKHQYNYKFICSTLKPTKNS
jgi:hypothetical protein